MQKASSLILSIILLEAVSLTSDLQCYIPFRFTILFDEMSSSRKYCNFATASMLEIELHFKLRIYNAGKFCTPAIEDRHYFYECITFNVLMPDLSATELAMGSKDL